ncbi:DUF485 domain-containing protein [Streptomyces sp. NPDC047000]|uniref:DUF485 domain-containing protein n=1 Tax=Streptomyces sp. NPDC047000 TaxID=3155474 RepID=UPI0033F6CCC1
MPHGDTPAWSLPDSPGPTTDTDDTGTGTGTGTATDGSGRGGHPGFQVLYGTEPLAEDTVPGRRGSGSRPRPGHHGDLRRLRRTYRVQRRTTTFLALGYFTAFLVLSALRPAFMTRPLVGGLPAGLVLALAHIPVTWLAVLLYERTARRFVDPLAFRVTRHTPWAGGTGQEQGR